MFEEEAGTWKGIEYHIFMNKLILVLNSGTKMNGLMPTISRDPCHTRI